MTIRDRVPRFGRERENTSVARGHWDPFRGFQREINSLFDDFLADFPVISQQHEEGLAPSVFIPKIDVSESDNEMKISAELPGMDEKDISVEIENDSVTIRGERKENKEDKGKNWYRREQSYGSFSRLIPLPSGVEGEKARAKFKKGVLNISVPKKEDEQAKRKTITIETD